MINLADKAESKAGALAHGQKQWLESACSSRKTRSYCSSMNRAAGH
jgi:hypothetical protein